MFHELVPDIYNAVPRSMHYRRAVWASLLPRWSRAFARIGVSSALALADVATIFAVGPAVKFGYFYAQFGTWKAPWETLSPHVRRCWRRSSC